MTLNFSTLRSKKIRIVCYNEKKKTGTLTYILYVFGHRRKVYLTLSIELDFVPY